MRSDTALPEPGESMFAVIVLYRQSLEQSVTFQSLRPVVRDPSVRLSLLVYDNSPTPVGRPGADLYPGWDIHYVHDPSNPGVSRAYVEGARLAAERSKQWLLLLDQDTRFPADALERYLRAIRQYPEARLFGPILRSQGRVVSPCLYLLKVGVPLRGIGPGLRRLTGLSVLNSGMCVALEDYIQLGGHDLRLALDFADHEFVDRFRRRHDTFVVVEVECDHGLSGGDTPSSASQMVRFHVWCRGAMDSSTGLTSRLVAAGVVGVRACLLALRHRRLDFLRVAGETLLRGRRQ